LWVIFKSSSDERDDRLGQIEEELAALVEARRARNAGLR
jgi:hypothetical protein